MELRIKERYNQEILRGLVARYGIDFHQLRLLDGFESYIYEFERKGKACILRVGHSLRRSEDLVRGEVDWINFLADGGVQVCRAIPSLQGRLVESVEDGRGGRFVGVVFVKASGIPPGQHHWNNAFNQRYGALIGKIHRLSKRYLPPNPAWRRPQWDDHLRPELESWLPPSDKTILEKYEELAGRLATIPKSVDSYGLIHQDAHAGNLFVDESGHLTLFDFDDCCYSWFVNDIAIVLFYSAFGQDDERSFSRRFMTHFMQGYLSENKIDPGSLRHISWFLKLREIDLYAVIHRSFDVSSIQDPWVASFMLNRKERIVNDIPFIDYDFAELAGNLNALL